MKKITKILKVFNIKRVGAIDILIGIMFLPTLVIFQGPTPMFVLGIVYVIFGFKAILKEYISKWLLFIGIIPLTIFSVFILIMLGTNKVPEYFRIPLLMQIVSILFLLILGFVNVYVYLESKGSKE